MERRLLLDVVVTQGTTILELFAGEDKTLLVGRNAGNHRQGMARLKGEIRTPPCPGFWP